MPEIELDNPSSVVDHLFNTFSISDIETALMSHNRRLVSGLDMKDIISDVRNEITEIIENCDAIKCVDVSQRRQFVLAQLLEVLTGMFNSASLVENNYKNSTYCPTEN